MRYLAIVLVAMSIHNANAGTVGSDCEGEINKKHLVEPRNVVSISIADYDANPQRGEFEKKTDFIKRVNQAKSELASKVDKETIGGKFYILKNYDSYQVTYDIDRERITLDNILWDFPLEKSRKVYKSLGVSNEAKKEDYQGYKPRINLKSSHDNEIAFNSRHPYLNKKHDKLTFKLKSEVAKNVKDNLALIVVGTPTPPYIIRFSNTYLIEGGLEQTNRQAATMNLVCAAIIDNRTGKIVYQIL